jgi:hypothetical protein
MTLASAEFPGRGFVLSRSHLTAKRAVRGFKQVSRRLARRMIHWRRLRSHFVVKRIVPMKWSWRIGHIFGVDLYMHATFLLILAWVAFLF